LRIKIRFQKFINVDCETTTFNEKIEIAAVTRQIVAIQLGQPALVELGTLLNWPFKLFNGALTKYPLEKISSFEFSSIDCNSQEGYECQQYWRTNLHLSENTCRLDGEYAMNFSLACGEDVPQNECPIKEDKYCRIEYKLRSEDFCAEMMVDVGVYGYMNCYANVDFVEHSEICIVENNRYFIIKVNSDLNPKHGAVGALGADYYDENSNETIITFSEVKLLTVTVRIGDKIFKIFENGNPCKDDYDTGIKLEKSKLDGSIIAKNQVAFSFTFARRLVSILKQNSKLELTVGAEVEVIYSDMTRKRVTLEQQVDKSTFSTTQQVQDNGQGLTNDIDGTPTTYTTKSNSIILIASFMLMVIFTMF